MDFNFKDKFKEYSNFELLKIIKQPHKFQAEAVEAAAHILEERTISEKDSQELDAYLGAIEEKAKQKVNKINAYKDKANDFLEPIIKPSSDIKPAKWLSLFLVFLFLEYIWELYDSIKTLILYLDCTSCSVDPTIILVYLSLFYTPVIIYLLYKRRKWGWILIFADNIFTLIIGFSNIYFYFKYPYFISDTLGTILFLLFIKAGFIYFLRRPPITELFGISPKTKKNTLFITIALAILYLGTMLLLYG